ncbi:hypothetical protein ABT158_15715 [Nonomuraea sp. NPDC001636]|uniref:hypothetical protein n=1 Tax=Nonomuraea sp. NPDC001636 TaxID=3154391 RepID=UPI003324B5B4
MRVATDAPRTVYEITDASPPRTPPAIPAAWYARLLRRAIVAVAALMLAGLLLGGAFTTWRWLVVPMLLAWVAWPWLRPALHRVATVALLILGALDALIAAILGTRRLVYLAGLLRQAVRESRTAARPGAGAGLDDEAPFSQGDAR